MPPGEGSSRDCRCSPGYQREAVMLPASTSTAATAPRGGPPSRLVAWPS
ncbi:MAG: hypothetical protein U5L98_01045 [Halomonas sp.]|nr:hypothetical protein [Halomonas sp.]MDZ7851257.1 hypothetical protein [Halomonas sp.]